MIEGFATPEGTARYRERFPEFKDAGHFRQPQNAPGPAGLWFSSMGIGTYLGEPDEASDQLYTDAISTALRRGINLVDTAINYRHQRSERNIRAAISRLISEGEINRDELIVCSKAGYLSFDGAVPADPRAYFMREYVEPGVFKPAELAGGMHCMSPGYLLNQLERSRKNLGLGTIDVYYIHNPESQLGDVSREEFRQRIKSAFGALERAVKDGKIRFYGIASWSAFRVAESEQAYMSLPTCVELAEQAGGRDHHFRFVQLPFNLAMPEAHALPNQVADREHLSALEYARKAGLAVIGSASLYQAQLTSNLPLFLAEKIGMQTDAERALQFARSTPGLLTSLVGMGRPAHVFENINVAAQEPMKPEQWQALFSRT